MTPLQQCRSCGLSVYWLANDKTGKPAPIDSVPDPKGNIIILPGGKYHVLTKEELASATPRTLRYTSHFSTCEQACTWRRSGYHQDKRKKQEAQ